MGRAVADSQRKVSVFVKLFVLFHVIAITVWAIPEPRTAIKDGRMLPTGTEWLCYWNDQYLRHQPVIADYDLISGFWQYWDMFAPNPTHVDTWADADVIYRDGTAKHYQYPRMFLLPIWKKFFNERYRKFFERAGSNQFTYLWPPFGLRIALLNDNPDNPPVKVKLYRHTRLVSPPGSPQATAYKVDTYYTYVVDQKELARMRKLAL